MKYLSKLATINSFDRIWINKLLNFLIFLTPILTMFSLSCVTSLTCLILILLTFSNKFQISKIRFSTIEIIFTVWGFLTCFWAAEPLFSLSEMIKLTILVVWCKIILIHYNLTPLSMPNTPVYALTMGLVMAISFFTLEYFSQGAVTNLDKNFMFSHKGDFALFRLDGGCTFLAALLWIVIDHLLQRNKAIFACLLYLLVLITLLYSDSLASIVACILSLSVFLIVRFLPYGDRLIKYSVIIASMSVIVFFSSNYDKIGQVITKYPNINYSWAHRLSIYSFFTEESLKHPIIGNGIRTAKNLDLRSKYYKSYQNQLLSPVPVTGANQPHNIALEIWLDTGLVGLILFMGLIYQFLSRSFENRNNQACYYSCFSSYYIIGSISNGAWNTSWLMTAIWLCLMIESTRYNQSHNLINQNIN